MGESANPAEREEIVKLTLHDAGFVNAVSRGSTSDGFGVAGVDAEFVVEDWSTNADGNERVPVFMDD